MSIWQQRLETNNWDRECFNRLVQGCTKDIKREDYKSEQDFLDMQRRVFFNRVDILCVILSFSNLMLTAGLTVVYSVLNRDDGIEEIIDNL